MADPTTSTDAHSDEIGLRGVMCEWDHITRANPTGRRCGRPAKVEVNSPNGYFVCGIHARSAAAIGDIDQASLSGTSEAPRG